MTEPIEQPEPEGKAGKVGDVKEACPHCLPKTKPAADADVTPSDPIVNDFVTPKWGDLPSHVHIN